MIPILSLEYSDLPYPIIVFLMGKFMSLSLRIKEKMEEVANCRFLTQGTISTQKKKFSKKLNEEMKLGEARLTSYSAPE